MKISRRAAQGWQRHPRLLATVTVLVLAALVAVALVLTGAGGGNGGAAAQTPAGEASDTSAPTTTAPPTTTAKPSGAAPTGDPNKPPPSLAPVALDKTAAVGNGITAEVASLNAVRGSGRGPGNIAGPALRATVRIVNRTGGPVSLDGVAVDLSYGKGRTPASPLDDPTAAPFRGTLKPGGTAEGSYVFSVPAADRDTITLSVGYQAGAPFLVFTGSGR